MKNLTFGLGALNLMGGRTMAVLIAALLVVALAAAGCASDGESTDESSSDVAETGASSGQPAASSGASGQSSAASASSQASGPDSTVSAVNQNPSGSGPDVDYSRNAALRNATPLDAVTWTTNPTVGGGELAGAGAIAQGTDMFEPMIGDGPTFAVYFPDHDDPMVILLPDLGPMEIWNSNHTIADMSWEREATSFTFRAYSPLFMDAGGDLEIHVFGYDADGNDALLSVTKVGAGQGTSGELPPLPTPVAAASQSGASAGASGSASSGSSQSAAAGGVVSAVNQNPTGAGPMLDYGPNEALRNATPLDAVRWTQPPTIEPGEISGAGEIEQDALLFSPMMGEGAALALYYAGHDDPLLVLLPGLGPMQIWNTEHTVAEMDYEVDGTSFSFRAYSPMFYDSGGELELLVFGFDADYNEALLSATKVGE